MKHGVSANDVATSILAELQLSFVLFFVGQSFSALEQWKRLVDVLCRPEDILLGKFRLGDGGEDVDNVDELDISALKVASRALLFTDAYSIIQSQVSEIPSDTPELTADSFLIKTFFALSRTQTQSVKMKQDADSSAPICNTSVSDSIRTLLSKSRSVLHWDDTYAAEEMEEVLHSSGADNMEDLLKNLAEEGGDGDLPEIIYDC